ncbi:MAG TPA: hypothetical protein VG273_27565, partial [Bryobacteraceae bacterium]|nr:hypothetical protein [Bryobacteraceae bacterium]
RPLSAFEPGAAEAVSDHVAPAPAEDAPPPATQLSDSLEPPKSFTDSVATRDAGLFYLCDRIMELDLAESLWKACLPEGVVLAVATSALLGPHFSDDPAAALFGGTTKFSCPRVTAAQQSEIAIATCAALAAALPRRGIAAIPPATVALVDHPAGRLLVAAAENSPFAFFAWPAGTPKMVSAGVEALLGAWPHNAILTASPALATLDVSGRLRPSREPGRVIFLLPHAGSAPAAALLALVIGAPCLLFAARAGADPFSSADAFVDRFLALPGHIRTGPEQMEILFRGQDVDVAVRRAGLDRDPCWLPWLRRSVRLIFEGQEIAQAGQP